MKNKEEELGIENLINENPILAFEIMLKGALTNIYTAKKINKDIPDWLSYSDLLIDKFAIHSATYYHLARGIIEHKKSGEVKKMNGYDLFTVNTTIRAIIETYVTFNHIFVEPKSLEEKEFKFLLWKLDGLYQKDNYEIKDSDFEGVSKIKEVNQKNIEKTIHDIKENRFYKSLSQQQLKKILIIEKKRVNWRFLIINEKIHVLKIIQLIKHVCKTRAFVNTYKYSSIHTHSNFPAIEEFKLIRGKEIKEDAPDSMTTIATYVTCLLIYDICEIDINAKKTLSVFPKNIQNFIIGIRNSIKNKDENL